MNEAVEKARQVLAEHRIHRKEVTRLSGLPLTPSVVETALAHTIKQFDILAEQNNKVTLMLEAFRSALNIGIQNNLSCAELKKAIQVAGNRSETDKCCGTTCDKSAVVADTTNLDKMLNARVSRSSDIEKLLLDMATGKRPLPSAQDCRVMALRLGTPVAKWTEPVKNHVWEGCAERDALAAQVEVLQSVMQSMAQAHLDDGEVEAAEQFLMHLKPTPAACLAQVKADAFIQGAKMVSDNCSNCDDQWTEKQISDAANERIRQGGA